MDGKIKINLGCGLVYKPGYVNIDNFDESVADMICNADDLPFMSNSVDVIEAYHLLEHFDYIHCKYVLSEWFRILKPDGKLILETPDLDKSLKKFESVDFEAKRRTLQWLYGIDNPGMQHKTGFTLKLLSNLLGETGFKEISKEVPCAHKYEPGLRVECKKPKDHIKYQFFSIFRKKIKQKLSIDESDLLSSLEDYCITQIKDIFYKEFDKDKRKAIKKIISKSAISNPSISLIFCEKCIEFDFFTKNELKNEINLIKYLIKIEFHKKLINLWKKSKKEVGKNNVDFIDFLNRLESKISKMLDCSNCDEFKYVSNLEPEEVKVFNFHVVHLRSMILSNMGVKEFSRNNYDKAQTYFLESAKLYPDNHVVYWNLARLGIITNKDKSTIDDYYEKSLCLMKERQMLNILKRESKSFKNDDIISIPAEPIGGYI